jgi:hypothetical protein
MPADDHFVARTYLKRWCDRTVGEPMQAYRKSSLQQFPCWPEDVCTEPGGDLNPDYFVDARVLGQFRDIFEPHWDAAVEALHSQQIGNDEKFVIAGYWANLTVMTPAWRAIGVQLFKKELLSILPLITEGHPAPENVKLDIDIDPNYIKALATRSLLRHLWQFYHQSWSVLDNASASHPLLTSDNPSAILPPLLGDPSPSVRVLPVSPSVCIATLMDMSINYEGELSRDNLQMPSKGSISYNKLDDQGADFVNRLTVQNADDLVLSRTAKPNVAALVEELRDHGARLMYSTRQTPGGGLITHSGIYVGKKK